jgi:thymidylate synthase (FAD)
VADVELLACMGDDLMVVDAARVSFSKKSSWDVDSQTGQPVLAERDRSLIRYLASHGHWSPFSHPQIQFRLRMPLVISVQWFKHVVGFARNSVSRRYVKDLPTIFNPAPWRQGAAEIKQGSSDALVVDQQGCDQAYNRVCQEAVRTYQLLLDNGVAAEQARMVLPLSMYTEFIETASLYGYARLCRQRLDRHAQKEIRDYAQQVAAILAKKFPVAWAALLDTSSPVGM